MINTEIIVSQPITPSPKLVPELEMKNKSIPRVANIFGHTVSSQKFGAILDISNSTHKTIDFAVNEISDGFPDVILVLAPGCGMKEGNGDAVRIVTGRQFEKNVEE